MILCNPYPKMSYPSSSKTKWQKPDEKVIKKLDCIDTFFSEMGYMPKKASSRLPHPSTLSTLLSLHQAMLDRTLTELPNPMIHTGTAKVNNDCLYYGQAMKANDRNNFRKAMSVKLKVHINWGHWVKIPRSTAIPKDVNQDGLVIQAQVLPWRIIAQTQSPPVHSWWHARERSQLLGNLFACRAMVYHMALADTIHHGGLVGTTD
jgi:hypothetical protein